MPFTYKAGPISVASSPMNQEVSGPNYESLFGDVIKRLSGGGDFLKSAYADIATGKRRGMATAGQNLVSSGLSGTTMRAGIPIAAEEVAGRARLGARSEAESRYTNVMSQFAHLGEASRQAELERRAGMERTKTLAQSQEAQNVVRANVAEQGYGGAALSRTAGGMAGSRTPLSSGTGGGSYSPAFPSLLGMDGGRSGATFGVPGFRPSGGSIGGTDVAGNILGAGGDIIGTTQTAVEQRTVPNDGQDVMAQIRNAKTFAEYTSIARGAGMVVGSEQQWQSARKRFA